MEYQKAKDIRSKSFGDLMTENILQNKSIGGSLSSALSEKTKANVKGIKEKFDPLNIAKFVTGGSSLGPAILGKILGRKKEDIKFFSGKTRKGRDTASKLGPTENLDFIGVLYDIEGLLLKSNEEYALQRDKENNFAEEKESERLRRHKELIEAITGKKYTSTPTTAEKVKEDGDSLVNNVLEKFGLRDLGKSVIKGLGSLATAAVGGIGGVLLGGAAAAGIAYFMYKVLTDESSYDKDPNSPFNLALKQAEAVGGLAGVKDEMEKRKKLPEYERTMAEIQDYETYYNEGRKLNDTQLQGFAKRGSESLAAVEDYKIARDKYLQITGEKPTVPGQVPMAEPDIEPTITPSSTGSSATQVTSAPSTEPSSMTPTASDAPMATPMVPPTNGEKLNSVTNENLTTNIQEMIAEGLNVVNNSSIKQSLRSQGTKTSIPPVRNMEESFQKMIFESTRIV
jgi:hypothetical protein